jgi:hypothetical protein
MIKLKDIVTEIINEGGKLFGTRANRVTTSEMNSIFDELKSLLNNKFNKFELSKSLPSKVDHGDIDVVVSGGGDVDNTLKSQLGGKVLDYSRNGNIYSVLYKSNTGKNVHIDFIHSDNDEDFDAQRMYLALGDFSGILGVMARQNGYKYATTGFHKIYVDKSGRHHDILITKNLKDGLKILGYGDVLGDYDNIQNNDDVIKFISSSPMFDSNDYKGQTMNHSDRKRVRAGRPSADYIRTSLIGLNKHKQISDSDYFLKKLFPDKYQMLLDKQKEIESFTPVKSKYGGEWLMANFPQLKPGPILGKIKQYWTQKYGDNLDNVPEDELRKDTDTYIKSL